MRRLIPLLCLVVSCQSAPQDKAKSEPVLRIAMESDVQSIDPRQVRDLGSMTICRMLFEGLVRPGKNPGELEPGIAERFDVSPDHRVYTFHLRESVWSNGQPLTADDFERSWREALRPDFPAPNIYQMYPIKGAREAKRGQIPVEDVAVRSPDALTLIVELEEPSPYFLELLTSQIYFPVS
ncbi:MAG: peptide ABC transporter substrate-binding protein, partial [Chlamydiia bacterium]|nr:peptide ABC transporter substrate-binding protein [Chlamydiia bacterium]